MVRYSRGCVVRYTGRCIDCGDPHRTLLNRDVRDPEEAVASRLPAAVRAVLHHRRHSPRRRCSRRTAAGRHSGTRLLRQGQSTLYPSNTSYQSQSNPQHCVSKNVPSLTSLSEVKGKGKWIYIAPLL